MLIIRRNMVYQIIIRYIYQNENPIAEYRDLFSRAHFRKILCEIAKYLLSAEDFHESNFHDILSVIITFNVRVSQYDI